MFQIYHFNVFWRFAGLPRWDKLREHFALFCSKLCPELFTVFGNHVTNPADPSRDVGKPPLHVSYPHHQDSLTPDSFRMPSHVEEPKHPLTETHSIRTINHYYFISSVCHSGSYVQVGYRIYKTFCRIVKGVLPIIFYKKF